MPKQILAIALCRVSSLEQLQSHSLDNQKDKVLRAAEVLGATIPADGIWSGHVSSKKGVNYDRKDLKEMLEYCKKTPNVKYLIVQEVDRFMRSPDEQVYFQVKFSEEVGVKIWYADKPELNEDNIYAGLMRYMEGFRAAGSNDERQRKSITGQTNALNAGRYPFAPKPGYIRGHIPGIQELHPVRGKILQDTLISIVTKRLSPTQALIKLNDSEYMQGHSPYKMDKFRTIVTDPFYAGIVEIDKQVQVRNENGLHEPLITKEQHNKLLEIMNAKKKVQAGPRKGGNPEYPLSNQVNCIECREARNGRLVGYKHGNGKPNSTLVYHKYRCRSCARYQSREELHPKIAQKFNERPVTDGGKQDLLEALKIVWEQNESQVEQDINRLQHSIDQLDSFIEERVNAATDPKYSAIATDIMKLVEKKKTERSKLQEQLSNLTTTADEDNERFLDFAFDYLNDIGKNFFSPDVSLENRLRCKQAIFPAGFWVDKNRKVYTPEISYLYRLAEKKKDARASNNSLMVRHS
ncbi:MAG TPA: recombinase family protein [Candidatus Saccharimonadales bacterium]|nr:recombinase family protein [Candidatus Saccharimonadales bacterium]